MNGATRRTRSRWRTVGSAAGGSRSPPARTTGRCCAGAGHQCHESWSARVAPYRPRTPGHLRDRRRRTHHRPRDPSSGAVGGVGTAHGADGWTTRTVPVARAAGCGVSHHRLDGAKPLLCARSLAGYRSSWRVVWFAGRRCSSWMIGRVNVRSAVSARARSIFWAVLSGSGPRGVWLVMW